MNNFYSLLQYIQRESVSAYYRLSLVVGCIVQLPETLTGIHDRLVRVEKSLGHKTDTQYKTYNQIANDNQVIEERIKQLERLILEEQGRLAMYDNPYVTNVTPGKVLLENDVRGGGENDMIRGMPMVNE